MEIFYKQFRFQSKIGNGKNFLNLYFIQPKENCVAKIIELIYQQINLAASQISDKVKIQFLVGE